MNPDPGDYLKYPGYGGTFEDAIKDALRKRREAGFDDEGASLEIVIHHVQPWRRYHDMFGESFGHRHMVMLK